MDKDKDRVIDSAITAARRDGYGQVVLACEDGSYSFTREANGNPVTPVFSNERIIGRVIVFWEHGVLRAVYASEVNQKG